MSSDRVMVFIDGSNLFRTCEELDPPIRPDIFKLRDLLVSDRRHIRTYYFCSIGNPPKESQLKFIDKLKASHIEVVVKQLKYRGQNEEGKPIYVEKGVDIALVTSMLSMACANAFDVAILVSGDDDYEQAVEEIKRVGKRVEIAFFEIATSREFKYSADDYISLDEKIRSIKL